MGLEEKTNEGGDYLQTAIDLGISTLATIGAYNLAGTICSSTEFSNSTEKIATAGILTLGAILGYKSRSIVSRIKNKQRRKFARLRIVREMSKDTDFLNRQQVKREELGITKRALKYLLTIPAGGALGYFPGSVGIVPLCVYFGKDYNWGEEAALGSGTYAGSAIAAFAFAEMANKKQWKRIVTSASALAGATAGYFINQELHLNMIAEKEELWLGLGICAASAAVTGIIGNGIYKSIEKLITKKTK